ncbi:MAG: DUF3857 domain-containing protein [Gemmatimonadota bacterium]
MLPAPLRLRILACAATLAAAQVAPLAAPLAAQAPLITAAGDPSVDADTIYALAADTAVAAPEPAIFLLDDGVITVDAAGRGTRTYRQIVHVREQRVVAGFAERRLRYSPDHQTLRLNWARVLTPAGDVISDAPAQLQESDVTAATSNPVYVNQKEVRFSLGGVAPNTIIDVSYTIEDTARYHEGDFHAGWAVHGRSPATVRRSRFIFDVPAGVEPRITEKNLSAAGITSQHGDRRTYAWSMSDVPPYRAEPFAPDTNSVRMYIQASLPLTWADVGRWYGALSDDRYVLSPAAAAKVDATVANAASRLDTIRAVHRWVAQDIRYVSVSLGLGGYQPRLPDETVTTGFGDCKDKTTLFIAALRSVGIEAHPVLLNTNHAAVSPEHPSIHQFNHLIAAVAEGGRYTFTDPTSPLTPYGELPYAEQDGFALVVLPDGSVDEVRLPRISADERRIEYRISATLSDAGQLAGSMEEVNTGPGFEARRAAFSAPLDSAREASVMRALLSPMRGATGDSIAGFDGRDLYAPVRYTIWFSGGRGTDQTGGLELFMFPFGVLNATGRIQSIERAGARRTSINAVEVLRSPPPTTLAIDMSVTLPEGWRARVPDDVVVEGDFGTYSTEYSQEGRVFRIVRREQSAVGVYPPERLPDVLAFFRAIGADEDNRTIVIDRGGTEQHEWQN